MANRNRQSPIRNRLCQVPGTITAPQLQKLHSEARKRGLDTDALHNAAGVDSLKQLSRAQASELIERLTGQGLSSPPGQPPKPPKRKGQPGVTRMITTEQVEQIERLGLDYFRRRDSFEAWLLKYHKAATARDLATAKRASQVRNVLRTMLRRREGTEPRP